MTIGQLQTARNLLLELQQGGVADISAVIASISSELDRQRAAYTPLSRDSLPRRQRLRDRCPACGHGPLSLIPDADPGVTVLQCKKCRWSKMVEV